MSDYFKKPGLSFHQLKDCATVSPLYYYRRYISGELPGPDSDAMRVGRIVHLAALEPDKFATVPVVPAEHLTPSGGLSTKAATRVWLESLPSRDFSTPEELAMCGKLADAVRKHPEVAPLLVGGQVEVEGFVDFDGVGVKARADLIAGGGVWDLKTTRNLDTCVAEARDLGYVEQLAWYARVFQCHVGGLIMVEKAEPFRCMVLRFAGDAIRRARARNDAWLNLYRSCLGSGIWPNNPPSRTVTAADLDNA
jgi:hypothetical protein